MSARHKLNAAYFNGSLLASAIFGAVAGSWLVFWITLIVTLVGGLYGGDIRPGRTRERR